MLLVCLLYFLTVGATFFVSVGSVRVSLKSKIDMLRGTRRSPARQRVVLQSRSQRVVLQSHYASDFEFYRLSAAFITSKALPFSQE